MSGLALIIPDVDFGARNIGKVTPIGGGDVPLTGISINGAASVYEGNSATYSVDYTPENTTEKGVAWSVVSGGQYAIIDSEGRLSVLAAASEAQRITIRATSTARAGIVAEKEVSVKYETKEVPLTGIKITGGDTIAAGVDTLQLGIEYTPSGTTQKGVKWGTSDMYTAVVNGSGLVSVTLPHRYMERQVTIKAVSTIDESVFDEKTITIKAEQATDYVKDGLVADYDAIDNQGTGTHSDSSSVWKDLAGAYDMDIRMSQYTKYWKAKAYDLTGASRSDLVNTGFTREGYPLQNVGSGDFTLEITFTTNSGMYDAHLGFFLYAYVTGRFQFAIDYKNGGGTGYLKASLYSSGFKDYFYLDEDGEKVPVTNADEFHVVAFARSGATWKVYDNGVLRGTFTLAGFNLLSDSSTMLLAQDGQPFAYHSYKFYNKALTDTEAAQNYSFEKNYYK